MLKSDSTMSFRTSGLEVIMLPRKTSKLRYILPVPQTDTGSQVENTKVLEGFMAKELGKLVS